MDFALGVYRATPAGIMAAITASRLGMRAVIIEPSVYIGGLMTSGLNATDTVDKRIITGLAREFFIRAKDFYGLPYIPVRVESKVAGKIFADMLREAEVEVLLERDIVKVERVGTEIQSVKLASGEIVHSRWWVDASYEGDLMAKAGISYSVGRESQDEFGEAWAGVQPAKKFLPWGGHAVISPKINGSYIPYVSPPSSRPVGSADDSVQSYCIRVTLTNNPKTRVKIDAPEDFNFGQFDFFRELARPLKNSAVRATWHRHLGITFKSAYFNLAEIPNGKFDMNSGPLAPINSPALTKGWIEASYDKRVQMTEEFSRYTRAILYYIQNDDAVPFAVRSFFSDFGLPKDEYESTGHFPPQVYVREGRRLRGEKVFTQNHVESGGVSEDEAICHAKYHLDCKPVAWRANKAMTNVVREGMFFSAEAYRYALPAWIILPQRAEATNFFSVCGVSTSHVAFGSIRMEPTWMEFGSSAAMMAHLSEREKTPVHEVSASAVRELRDERFQPVQ